MYNQIEDILLNISIVIATVWIVKRFWGSFFEEKQNSILSVSLWIVYCIFQFFFGYHNGRLQIFATILNILLILSIAMVAYQSRGKEKYFLLATFYAGWSLIEVFVFSLINSFDIGEKPAKGYYWVGIIEHPDDPFCICTVDGGRKKKGESGTGKILFFSPVGASGKHSHCNQ